MNWQHWTAALGFMLATGGAHGAWAADPPAQSQAARVGGGEVIDFGSFECAAKLVDGKPAWTCPAQSFPSKFKEAPSVLFSLAGFERLSVADGSVSLGIDIKGDIAKDGFQPIVDDHQDKPTGMDGSKVHVTWIAIGEGERGPRQRPSREDRLKRDRSK